MASHEFRTPLSSILLSTELLEKYNSDKEGENRIKHYRKIKSCVHGLTDILMDFLAIDKFENGLVHNNTENMDLVCFTANIIEELNIYNQPVVYHHLEKYQPVYLDPKLLRICVTNVLGNALKYSSETEMIEVTTSIREKGPIVITVKDNGIGIAEVDKPFIFDRFFRASNAESFQGTGLGLNIVQKFVSVMQGSISFTSEENKGSAFEMTFPSKFP